MLPGISSRVQPGPVAVLAATFVSLLAPVRSLTAQQPETFVLENARVSIYNLAGTVEVVGHSGASVEVEVERRGPDGDRLEVAVDRIRGREALRVLFPDDRVVYPEARGRRIDIDVADDGTFLDDVDGGWSFGFWNDDVEIRGDGRGLEAWAQVRVLVPPGHDVATYLGAGEHRAEGVEADLLLVSGIGEVRTLNTRGSLEVDARSGGVTVERADGDILVDTGSGSVTLEEVAGDAEVDTGSGSVTVGGVTGDLLVDTGSGGVTFSSVEGGRIHVDTGSGSVEGEGITAESLFVDTGSGSVTLAGVTSQDIQVDTGSGGVSLELLGPVGDIRVDTGSGGVDLHLPPDADALVRADAGSGGFDSELPMEVESRRRGFVSGRLGEGRGRIDLDTGSGSVRIRGS